MVICWYVKKNKTKKKHIWLGEPWFCHISWDTAICVWSCMFKLQGLCGWPIRWWQVNIWGKFSAAFTRKVSLTIWSYIHCCILYILCFSILNKTNINAVSNTRQIYHCASLFPTAGYEFALNSCSCITLNVSEHQNLMLALCCFWTSSCHYIMYFK